MMTHVSAEPQTWQSWLADKLFMGQPFNQYVRGLVTPFNIVAVVIFCVGIPIAIYRFLIGGLEATTNLTDNYPWGLWIGFDVLVGVALAAGGFVLGSAVHLFGMRQYYPLVRPAILTGFLGYFFVVVGLCFDLGRPWRLPYPMLVSYGVTSVMFLVGWHVALYLTVQFLEFCPAIFEWLNLKKLRKWAVRYHVLGGVQINRMFDGIEATAKGGEVRNVQDRRMFKIDSDEWWKAILIGPYTTTAGKEYVEKLEGEKKKKSKKKQKREYIKFEK